MREDQEGPGEKQKTQENVCVCVGGIIGQRKRMGQAEERVQQGHNMLRLTINFRSIKGFEKPF